MSSSVKDKEKDELAAYFASLESELEQNVSAHFFEEPRKFKSLVDVIEVLGTKLELSSNLGDEKISLQVLQVRLHICSFVMFNYCVDATEQKSDS
jgi:hypothetical protein